MSDQTSNTGAHSILQDRAEKNARLLLALQMEEELAEFIATHEPEDV